MGHLAVSRTGSVHGFDVTPNRQAPANHRRPISHAWKSSSTVLGRMGRRPDTLMPERNRHRVYPLQLQPHHHISPHHHPHSRQPITLTALTLASPHLALTSLTSPSVHLFVIFSNPPCPPSR